MGRPTLIVSEILKAYLFAGNYTPGKQRADSYPFSQLVTKDPLPGEFR
jgi:hypothetical protein